MGNLLETFYHGKETDPQTWKMRLSSAFLNEDKSGDFEWPATVINLQPNKDNTLNKNCRPLYHYVKFVSMISENKKSGMEMHDAIEKAVDEAIKEKLLEGFFKKNKAEVIGMILTEFDAADAIRTWRNDGYDDGISEGRSQKAIEDATNLLKENIPAETIARCVNLPLEEILKIKKTLTVEV